MPAPPHLQNLDPERYELDEDGLPREIVGSWVRDKHARLEKYVGISRAVRGKFLGPGKAGATFVDLFCGPGRARVRDNGLVLDGSPLGAWREAERGSTPFTMVHIADADLTVAAAAKERLKRLGAPVTCEVGTAAETIDRIIPTLNPRALHCVFLDPYNLEALSFGLIRKFAALERVDLLIHVSLQDLQRNLRKYIEQPASPLDAFAPGWREAVDTSRSDKLVRGKIFEHWRKLLQAEGLTTTESAELVVGGNKQRLYWLAFAARHPRALEFWEKIRDLGAERQPSLL